jgi:hypothetical protein
MTTITTTLTFLYCAWLVFGIDSSLEPFMQSYVHISFHIFISSHTHILIYNPSI